MLSALVTGIILGLTAGLTPGPLMTLVIAQTLQYGFREGALIATAPLITDVPIILVSLFTLARLADFEPILGLVALVGSLYIFYLAYRTLRTSPVGVGTSEPAAKSLRKGAIINALNPHPYLFWATVGAPLILRAERSETLAPWLFVGSFYLFLIGSKVVIALIVGRFRAFLNDKPYIYIMRALAVLLAGLAILLFRDAFVLMRH